MGYSEIRCIFCSVSFNIGRIRLLDEPKEAGWIVASGYSDCKAASGCFYVPRQPMWVDESDSEEMGNDGDSSRSYVYESECEEEAYEYESDDDLVDSIMEDDVNPLESSDEHDQHYKAWLEPFKTIVPGTFPRPEPAQPIPIFNNSADDWDTKQKKRSIWENCEHIAGPDCDSGNGYAGSQISLEEMKGCTTFQCLMEKESNWQPLEDDEEFEIESNFFLTGLGIDMPSRDENLPTVFPARHGAGEIWAEDHPEYAPAHVEVAMPFHTTCFEAYKQFSRHKNNGKIELQRLLSWWRSNRKHRGPGNSAVDSCSDQWWQHQLGTEWLAANPIFVPLLPDIFDSVISKEPLDPHAGVFLPRDAQPTSSHVDLFASLPTELLHQILSYLPSSDIANVRLVSREFTQLPLSIFYALILEEMPWLWEVWSTQAPSFWTTTTNPELLARDKRASEHEADLQLYRNVIKKELPELFDDWISAEPSFEDIEPLPKIVLYHALPKARTNWYELFRAIKLSWKDLKGLQNRQRIWISINGIVEQF